MRNSFFYIIPALLIVAGCEKCMTPKESAETTFTASFAEVKSVTSNGIQQFVPGESIDIWDINTHELKSVELTESNISADGKKAIFSIPSGSDASILAIYPGGWPSNSWPVDEPAPHFNDINGLRNGIASAVCKTGVANALVFRNLLSCISFSSSVSVSSTNCVATLSGLADEDVATGITINPSTGAATACPQSLKKTIMTCRAADNPADIRLWALPDLVLSKGFSLAICTEAGVTAKERDVEVPFTLGANEFVAIGDIDNATSSSIDIEKIDVSFKEGTFSIIPSNDEFYYILAFDKQENLTSFTSDAQITSGIMESYFEKYGNDFQPYDSYEEYMLHEVCTKGSTTMSISNLDACTKYLAMAFIVDERMNILSGLSRLEFETSAAPSSFYSYEDYLGSWSISGTLVKGSDLSNAGSFENKVITISEKEDGTSYVVTGILSPLSINDPYIANYNNGCMDFPVGNENRGSTAYNDGAFYLFAHLAGVVTNGTIKAFSIVPSNVNNLMISGVDYIAGEYHKYKNGSVDPSPFRMTEKYMEITSITRILE